MTSYETDEPIELTKEPRKCGTENCNNQAAVGNYWCHDCSSEIRALWPDEWFQRQGAWSGK